MSQPEADGRTRAVLCEGGPSSWVRDGLERRQAGGRDLWVWGLDTSGWREDP